MLTYEINFLKKLEKRILKYKEQTCCCDDILKQFLFTNTVNNLESIFLLKGGNSPYVDYYLNDEIEKIEKQTKCIDTFFDREFSNNLDTFKNINEDNLEKIYLILGNFFKNTDISSDFSFKELNNKEFLNLIRDFLENTNHKNINILDQYQKDYRICHLEDETADASFLKNYLEKNKSYICVGKNIMNLQTASYVAHEINHNDLEEFSELQNIYFYISSPYQEAISQINEYEFYDFASQNPLYKDEANVLKAYFLNNLFQELFIWFAETDFDNLESDIIVYSVGRILAIENLYLDKKESNKLINKIVTTKDVSLINNVLQDDKKLIKIFNNELNKIK